MKKLFNQLINDSIIYSIGNTSTRLIGLLLVPLYTRYLSVYEFGVFGIFEVTTLILSQTLIFGQSHAILRFTSSDKNNNTQNKQLLFSIIIFLLMLLLFVFLLIQATSIVINFSEEVSVLLNRYLYLIFVIIFFRIYNNVFLSLLRAEQKSISFIIINVLKITLLLLSNFYFVTVLLKGLTGVLISYAISEIVVFFIFLPKIFRSIVFKLNKELLMEALKFGFPFIFTSFSSMILNLGDRYLIKYYLDFEQVGLYNLGYKISSTLNILFIQSVNLSFLPIAYKIYSTKKNGEEFYRTFYNYYMMLLIFFGLVISVFSREIVVILAGKSEYWAAMYVIPPIILGLIFSGAKSIVILGLYLKKKTSVIAIITLSAAALNIILNIILIPKYKIMGAAYATTISYLLIFISTNLFSEKSYPIHFNQKKLLILLLTGISLFCLNNLLGEKISYLKFIVILLYPIILYIFNLLDYREITIIKTFFRRNNL